MAEDTNPKKKVNWDKADEDIRYTGTQITLPDSPAKMPLAIAIEALLRKQKDEEQILDTFEMIDAYYTDALVALIKAMKEKYGWASPIPTPSFFGPKPPVMLTIKTGPNKEDAIQAPFGSFKLPGVENPVQSVMWRNESGEPVLAITGKIRKREQTTVKELAELAREILARESIYKGKAIRLRTDEDGDIDTDKLPEFLPTAYINPGELVLNPGEREQIETALWTPIRHTEHCRKHKIPLKRGVLLSGPYGCGKTMVGNTTSQVCVDNGWTYILLDDVRALKEALLFARRYAPSVIFAEDVERVIQSRDQQGNDLINTVDGVLSKDGSVAVITVLTTNFVEKIDKAMLRPGRLDAVITVKAPEAASVEKLVHIYARQLLARDADLSEVGVELAGNIPATIREVVERSKLAMIGRGDDHITPADLLLAARGMKEHLALLAPKPQEFSPEERFGRAFKEMSGGPLANGLGEKIEEMAQRVDEIHDATV